MIIDDLRNADFTDLGSAPGSVRYLLLSVVLILIVVAGYYLFIEDKRVELEQSRQQELTLLADFEYKQQKAANLEAYEQQLVDMQELLKTMFRQLPSKTEMDKLLVDVSQTALAAGIDVQLQKRAELGISDSLVRLSVGIEDVNDLINELNSVL